MVDSEYKMYLESIDSHPNLSISSLKKVGFNKDNLYDELLPFFFKKFPSDIAFSVKYDNDDNTMSNNFSTQYDDLYLAGARNIVNNKNYKEEYEYFAPLYIFNNNIPKNFIVFRIDGPGLLDVNKDNFRDEILNKLKTVKVFDLSNKTPLGEWIDNNFNNLNFPNKCLDVDFRLLEFTRWYGIDYETGGYTYKPAFIDENLEYQNPLFDLERFFTDGFETNKIVHPQIMNFNFLFDDTPATPITLRKWSLNRYMGFYLDNLTVYDNIHPYKMSELHPDTQILTGNIIESVLYKNPFVNGFKNDWVEIDGAFYRVESFEEKQENQLINIKTGNSSSEVLDTPYITRYRIISDIDFTGYEAYLNIKQCYIDTDGRIIDAQTGLAYQILNYGYSDVNLIEIDGVFHNIIFNSGYYQLVTDYGFDYNEGFEMSYYTNSRLPGYNHKIDLVLTTEKTPIVFKIYAASFTDIKDFDVNIVNNNFARFEYEKGDDITKTDESKMYFQDKRTKSVPTPIDDFTFNGVTDYIPVASDYTANFETFRIDNNELTELWRKNPVHCRWGYQNSLSSADYTYLLNNTMLHEDFNRTTNTKELVPDISYRNLDYFYTFNSGTTSYTHHSLHIEKNIGGDIQDMTYKFELDKYLNHSYADYNYLGNTFSYHFNYFDILFDQPQSFLNDKILLNKKKYSYFDKGDTSIPSLTLFRGIKFKIFEVDSIYANSTSIEELNFKTSNKFENYKFSILTSSNDWSVNKDGELEKPYVWDYYYYTETIGTTTSFVTSLISTPNNVNINDIIEIEWPLYNVLFGVVTYVGPLPTGYGFVLDLSFNAYTPTIGTTSYTGIWRNKMVWLTISNFELDKTYTVSGRDGLDRFVLWNNRIYESSTDVIITDPTQNPNNSPYFTEVMSLLQFWKGSAYSYNISDWVYMDKEYYEYVGGIGVDFWDENVSYIIDDIVIYNNRMFIALENSVNTQPVVNNKRLSSKIWDEIPYDETNNIWIKIKLWEENRSYSSNTYVIKDHILYQCAVVSTIEIPGINTDWDRIYSFIPDSKFDYTTLGPLSNKVIEFGNIFYYLISPSQYTHSRLNSGITIYINERWKNILINIYINDNTDLIRLKNVERDYTRVSTNARLTAANFIKAINDLDTLYGFTEHTQYVVINENNEVKRYDFSNITELPYFILCEEADELEVKNSINIKAVNIPNNILASNKVLDNGIIELNKLNYYDNLPIAYEISYDKEDIVVSTNLNRFIETKNLIWRHSGLYMPVFYDIELFTNSFFEKNDYINPVSLERSTGNTLFNTDLTLFGIRRQVVMQKVNRYDTVLKLKNNDSYNSIYPMLDEFGYMVADFFIFKSTWDFLYHYETDVYKNSNYTTLYIDQIINNNNA